MRYIVEIKNAATPLLGIATFCEFCCMYAITGGDFSLIGFMSAPPACGEHKLPVLLIPAMPISQQGKSYSAFLTFTGHQLDIYWTFADRKTGIIYVVEQ